VNRTKKTLRRPPRTVKIAYTTKEVWNAGERKTKVSKDQERGRTQPVADPELSPPESMQKARSDEKTSRKVQQKGCEEHTKVQKAKGEHETNALA